MHTGRTTGFTSATGNGLKGFFQKRPAIVKRLFRQSKPAGDAVINEHGWFAHLRMKRGGDPAQIISVRHDQKRHNPDGCMLKGMNASHEMQSFRFDLIPDMIRDFNPEPLGFKFKFRQIKGYDAHGFLIWNLLFFIAGHLLGDFQDAVTNSCPFYK